MDDLSLIEFRLFCRSDILDILYSLHILSISSLLLDTLDSHFISEKWLELGDGPVIISYLLEEAVSSGIEILEYELKI